MNRITLTITGHTNAGKTALARTLLCRDVGEVRDAPHVTRVVEMHDWVSGRAWVLRLADTPGLDGAPRLLRRMRRGGTAVGWFLREIWDRVADPAFHHTQLALRQVMAETDVVLHVVDTAAEHAGPGPATRAEVELLGHLGRPVIVVLNQTGRALNRAEALASEQAWREALGGAGSVKGVATLDAFTRCWPCELLLIDLVGALLPESKRSGADEIWRALLARHLDVFRRSMRAIAGSVSEMAVDGESAGRAGVLDQTRRVVARLVSGSAEQRLLDAVHERLRTRLAERSAKMMNDLIALHGLQGESVGRILETQSADLAGGEGPRLRLRDVVLAAAGGAGAGGAIDAMVGGASMGAGLALGGVLGAMTAIGLGARGLAEAEDGRICWRPDALVRHLAVCLKSYLCVAHYGRAQGSWRDHDGPAAWGAVVEEVLRSRGDDVLAALHRDREDLARLCIALGLEVLGRLFPGVDLEGRAAAVAPGGASGGDAPAR